MRITWILFALTCGAACSKSEPVKSEPAAQARSTTKDPAKAREMIANGAIVIDVRTPEEFAEEHLPTATNIPLQDFAKRLADVEKLTGGDKAKPIVMYCGSGARSKTTTQQLHDAGYTNALNGGGLDDLL